MKFIVKDIDLYLSEVGDGDPDLQYTQQEEYVMHQRCLGRWKAKDENDLKDKIFDLLGHLRFLLSIYLDIFGALHTPLGV